MNAFNLIDGIDGLASSLSMLSLSLFGAYFLLAGQMPYAMLAFALAGSLLAFLIFNRPPARIFMGDSGSLLIGTVNSILVIHFIRTASSPSAVFPLGASVALGFAILFVPLLDTLRMFSVRLIRGRSPLSPDRNHLHHLLLKRGMGHAAITVTCVLINFLFVLAAWRFREHGSTTVMLSEVGFAFISLGILYYFRRKPSLLKAANEDAPVDAPIIDIMDDRSSKAE